MEENSIDAILVEAKTGLSSLNLQLEEAQKCLAGVGDIAAQATAQAEEVAEATKNAAAGLSDIQSKAETARSHVVEILTAKTQVEDLQAVIAAKSEHIEQAQVHADKVRANLDRLHTQATQKLNEIQANAENAESNAESVSEHQSTTKALRAEIEADKEAVDGEVEKINEILDRLQKFASNAERIEQKVIAYETKLEQFQKQMQERIASIDALLPGATSAGLATAFNDRRQTFLKPGTQWQWVFVGALTTLVLIALTGLWSVYRSAMPLSYDELFRLWLARLPIAGALVWLALYSSRESSLAKRLEEDYGYKAAVAASFQGFHKQMADITQQAGADSPVAKLCTDTLTTIAAPPGRIYDKHNLAATPSAEVAQMVKALFDRERSGAASANPK
ncbi:hypothetical protein SAMN05518854_1159 [Variovorax sp. YR266]|uniref:hypothetical protein n=1 Tax=Variovorax sp. YR266 TaxID=1884386 RepID=UPI000899E318|nr:hypothetical protein [Variovorax sp. YR266]SDZ70652.1 hypothetical protein SAMN05518854_1159 [Variovorax sp. YR266]